TDALQLHGLATRSGNSPLGITGDLPGKRLQHEHSMVVLRDERIELAPRAGALAGFFGTYVPDHAGGTSVADVQGATRTLGLPEAPPPSIYSTAEETSRAATLFSSGAPLVAHDLGREALQTLFGSQWRHEETDERGELLSFFHGTNSHVVLRSKELRVQRPHG